MSMEVAEFPIKGENHGSKKLRSPAHIPMTSARSSLNVISPADASFSYDKMRSPAPVLGCPRTIGGSHLATLSNLDGMHRSQESILDEVDRLEELNSRREIMNSMLAETHLKILDRRGISVVPSLQNGSGRLERKNPVSVLKALNDSTDTQASKGSVLSQRNISPLKSSISPSLAPSVLDRYEEKKEAENSSV